MAIATVAAFENTPSPSPRRAAASVQRVPSRVYSPFPTRRLARPMAVRADAEAASADPGRSRWSPFRGRRAARRDRSA